MLQQKGLIILIAFISLLAIFSFLISPFFQIRDLKIDGFINLSEEEINQALSPYLERNIWMIDRRDIIDLLLNNSYIKAVFVKKGYPDSLIINISERVPLGKINNNGRYLVFDRKGYILEEGSINTRAQVPEINGPGYSFSDNMLVFSSDLERIVQALDGINREARRRIKKINLNQEKTLSAKVLTNVEVYLGKEGELLNKFRVLESILNKIVMEDLGIEYIDLRIAQKPVIKIKN